MAVVVAGRARCLLVVTLSAVLVAGCTGSGSDTGSSSDAGSGSEAGMASDGAVGDGAVGDGAAGALPADAAADPVAGAVAGQEGRLVVSTGTVAVAVDDLDAAGRQVVAITAAAGGLVTASGTGTGTGTGVDPAAVPQDVAGSGGARYTLRVPGAAFTSVLDDVAALGRTTGRSTSAAAVTAEVADVDSRVGSAEAVLTTFRDRLPQATSIPDVLALEGEIARRQADLEALQARQRVLADQVALATVEVALTRTDAPAAAVVSDGGFTGGLATGWAALGTLLGAAAVVLGVVLPFLLPAALVAGAVVLVRRRAAARVRG